MLLKLFLLFLSANFCLADLSGIIRPCRLDDYKCIGDNLQANSRCKRPVQGFIPAEILVATFHFDTPYFNASYIDVNLFIRNLDKCYVSEFFFNTKTTRAVLAIDCPYVDLESDRTFIQHQTYQEDKYYNFHIKGVYPRLRFTINLPSITHMDLCSASIFTDVVALPKLQIDPKNKLTANALTKDLTYLNIYERENCHARGRPISFIFVDSLLCNYGCRLPK